MTEGYNGWDYYLERKRRGEQYKQIKEEWKDAVNDYFGITIPPRITIPPEDERTPTVAHMKQIEFQISKLRNDIYTIHSRINDIQNCGHGKLRKQLTPLVEGNVLGRIEALEYWREKVSKPDIIQLGKRVAELEEWKDCKDINDKNIYNRLLPVEEWLVVDRLKRLEEWKQGHIGQSNTDVKVIDRSTWNRISIFLGYIFEGQPMAPTYVKEIKKLVEELDK